MPIEFRCSGCSKLLRTPDEAAGKRAKCPDCGTIVAVPAAAAPPPTPDASDFVAGEFLPSAPLGTPSANPFADATSGPRPAGTAASAAVNPYAPPTAVSAESPFAAGAAFQPGLRHTRVDFNEALSRTWQLFSDKLGTCLLAGLVFLGVMIGLQVIAQIGAVAASLSRNVVAIVLFQCTDFAFNVLVQTWMAIGVLYFAVRLARGQPVAVGNLFAIGPYYWRGVGIHVVAYLIYAGILLVCLLPALVLFIVQGGPAALERDPAAVIIAAAVGGLLALAAIIWVFLRLYLALPYLLDRNGGVFESLRESDRFMQGNKLMVFLTYVVVMILGGMFALCTCYLGIIAFYPFTFILNAVLYLMATGQYLSAEPRTA